MKIIALYPYVETNPYQLLLSRALETRGYKILKVPSINARLPVEILALCRKAAAVHFHWIEDLYDGRTRLGTLIRTAVFVMILLIFRSRGTRMVYTLHNLIPHETRRARFHLFVRKLIVRLCHATIVHSRSALPIARQRLGSGARLVVIKHGHYRDFYPDRVDRAEARSSLGLPGEGQVALFFGSLFRYKGVDALLGAAKELANRSILLLVAGDSSRLTSAEREALKSGASWGLIFYDGFVPICQVQYLLRSADCLVLPYSQSFTSGAAILGLSFHLPIVGTRTAAFEELIDLKLCLPCKPDDPNSVAGTVEEICSWDREAFAKRCDDFLADCAWDHIAEQHLILYGFGPKRASN